MALQTCKVEATLLPQAAIFKFRVVTDSKKRKKESIIFLTSLVCLERGEGVE